MYLCMYVCMYVCIYIYICVCVFMIIKYSAKAYSDSPCSNPCNYLAPLNGIRAVPLRNPYGTLPATLSVPKSLNPNLFYLTRSQNPPPKTLNPKPFEKKNLNPKPQKPHLAEALHGHRLMPVVMKGGLWAGSLAATTLQSLFQENPRTLNPKPLNP